MCVKVVLNNIALVILSVMMMMMMMMISAYGVR